MQDLNSFIQAEKQKVQNVQNLQEQPKQNVKMSLLDLKRAVDSGTGLSNNPLVETIKKIDNIVEPVVGGTVTEQRASTKNNNFEEKEDEFTRQLLLKTKEFMTGKQAVQQVSENYNIQEIEPKYPQTFNKVNTEIPKENVIDVLKDTMLELYVKEKVEGIIKEYITSDEGKKIIKSIVINLFKKK
jgi:hypothetical protein